MFLLDTVVVSELRKKVRNEQVNQWIVAHSTDPIFLSALTIGEIRRGIAIQEVKNPEFASSLKSWLENLLMYYGNERILPVTTEIALAWGDMSATLGNSSADLIIAATAKIHHLTIVTRNVRHFLGTGVNIYNPWGE